MGPNTPENTAADQKKIIEELIHGRESAEDLKAIFLNGPLRDDELSVANDLVIRILSSFAGSISMMNRSLKDESGRSSLADSRGFDGRREDSGESSKTSVLRGKRACHKRRKTSLTSTETTPILTDDGYAWRKYGQKDILKAKHPRNYFRCTHKYDQGCPATKQVQKINDEPPMYEINYYGHHTCQTPPPPQIVYNSTCFNDSQFVVTFDSNHELQQPKFTTFPPVKHEFNPVLESSRSSVSNCLMSHDATPAVLSGSMPVFSPGLDDATSIHSNDFGLDFMEGATWTLDINQFLHPIEFGDN